MFKQSMSGAEWVNIARYVEDTPEGDAFARRMYALALGRALDTEREMIMTASEKRLLESAVGKFVLITHCIGSLT